MYPNSGFRQYDSNEMTELFEVEDVGYTLFELLERVALFVRQSTSSLILATQSQCLDRSCSTASCHLETIWETRKWGIVHFKSESLARPSNCCAAPLKCGVERIQREHI
jgi:hypothetical protein